MKWWADNRSLQVKSPFSNSTHTVYHYSVTNTAPRPESYLTGTCSSNPDVLYYSLTFSWRLDYSLVNGASSGPTLDDNQKAALYAELASGAESGWDYTMRWFHAANATGGLRNLNVRNTVAADLNSILCAYSGFMLFSFVTETDSVQLRTISSSPDSTIQLTGRL